MAIVLSTLTAPVTVDLGDVLPGVTVRLKRLTSPEFRAAQDRAVAAVRRLGAGEEVAATYNLPFVNRLSPAEMAQAGHHLGLVEVAQAAILGWTGVLLEDGAPAPVNLDTLSVFMLHQEAASRLSLEITKAARILRVTSDPSDPTEGNGSGPSPAGSTATRPGTTEVQTTAAAVMTPASPAPVAVEDNPAATARKSRTPRSPKRAGRSGAS